MPNISPGRRSEGATALLHEHFEPIASPTTGRLRGMTSPLCVAVAPYRPVLYDVSYHTLRRPASAFEAASSCEAAACFGDLPLTSAALVSATTRVSSPSRSPSPPGLLVAKSLRGGCATGRARVPRRRARRPLRRFYAPALVW